MGEHFTCALLENQGIKCWGDNSFGQLGLGKTSNHQLLPDHPIDFGTTARVIDISAGHHHACAIFETGQIKCWGSNRFGQLGYAHTKNLGQHETLDEVEFVDVGARVVSLSLSKAHSCALLEGKKCKVLGR